MSLQIRKETQICSTTNIFSSCSVLAKIGITLRHSRDVPFSFSAWFWMEAADFFSWKSSTSTSQHTESNRRAVQLNSPHKDQRAAPSGPAEGAGSSPEVRKRREILELYWTTIKQLQGPQLRSYMLLLSKVSLLLSFALRTLGTLFLLPHVRTHSPLSMFSHTSVLPQQNERWGSSWNRTSQWNESKQEPSLKQRTIIQHINTA